MKGFREDVLSESYLYAKGRVCCFANLILACVHVSWFVFCCLTVLQPCFGMLPMILEFPGRVNLLWFSCVLLLFSHCVFMCVFLFVRSIKICQKSKLEGKDQESIQSSTTLDSIHHMEK